MTEFVHTAEPKIYVTVFTPTYNRAALLPKLYESLTRQSCTYFEWLIVDDGSSDNTHDVIEKFIAEHKIPIIYIEQENAGKHIAVNTGVKKARGELFFIVDSDDWLPYDSIETIVDYWKALKTENNLSAYAGLGGNRHYADGKVNGGNVPYDVLDTDVYSYRHQYGIKGDKAEVYRTSILSQYPFPHFDGEKFCPESVVWYRIGEKYKLRFFNKGIYIGEYLTGGLTDSSVRMRAKSPRYTAIAYTEMINSKKMPFWGKVKSLINYWRFNPYNTSQTFSEKLDQLNPAWSILLYPLGIFLYLREKKTCNQ